LPPATSARQIHRRMSRAAASPSAVRSSSSARSVPRQRPRRKAQCAVGVSSVARAVLLRGQQRKRFARPPAARHAVVHARQPRRLRSAARSLCMRSTGESREQRHSGSANRSGAVVDTAEAPVGSRGHRSSSANSGERPAHRHRSLRRTAQCLRLMSRLQGCRVTPGAVATVRSRYIRRRLV